MEWLQITLWWSVILFFVGLTALPLTFRIFRPFSLDYAYPFAKTIGLIIVSYLIFVFSITHLLPFSRLSIIAIVLLIGISSFIFFKDLPPISKRQVVFFLFEECLFIGALLFWTAIRGQEPSIRSLEKFMDFGFINSILKSEFLPPKDMWYAGSSINYYYFGHLTGATLIKLTGVQSSIGYNLILSTIFALGTTQIFSFIGNIVQLHYEKIAKKIINPLKLVFFSLIGAFIVNFGGNLHTIYLFTSGYPNDQPIPFWKILSRFNPTSYWYPNATRFIPLTIHEFPSYSYVVADLHGHVFDIPFVILTISFLFMLFVQKKTKIASAAILGFLTAIHYMTNAFDGPIYVLFSIIILFFSYRFSLKFVFSCFILVMSFFAFSFPFSYFFKPFISGIGINCSPQFLVEIGRFGPFLFEKNNCQVSPVWMLFILWGFFWISFVLFLLTRLFLKKDEKKTRLFTYFFSLLFLFGTFLIVVPEFFYIKDIYPAHFRANTMFKLGYQAFILMGIASAFTFYEICRIKWLSSLVFRGIFVVFLSFVLAYPFFSIPSYYGNLNRAVELDGTKWMNETYPEDKEIIDFLNKTEKNQPNILEAQGDSYSDFDRISAFTGLPTVAGWWVHEWLWRGSPNVVSDRIPDITDIYESSDLNLTKRLLEKYQIKYIVISRMERQKYPNINEEKIAKIATLIFRSNNNFGALYQVK